jgi:hypothetical protein
MSLPIMFNHELTPIKTEIFKHVFMEGKDIPRTPSGENAFNQQAVELPRFTTKRNTVHS